MYICVYLNKLSSDASEGSDPRAQLAGLQLAGPSWLAPVGKPTVGYAAIGRPTAGFPAAGRPAAGLRTFWHAYSGYAACARPIAGFLQLAGLQQGLPQQAFHGQVCYSRFATTRFSGTGLLQQACHNKVSTGTFATAGLQHQVFHGQVCFSSFATTRFPGAGLQ